MEKFIKISENEKEFSEIMKYSVIDTNVDNWEYSTKFNGFAHARPLYGRRTGFLIGWFVFEQTYDVYEICEETYISLRGESFFQMLEKIEGRE